MAIARKTSPSSVESIGQQNKDKNSKPNCNNIRNLTTQKKQRVEYHSLGMNQPSRALSPRSKNNFDDTQYSLELPPRNLNPGEQNKICHHEHQQYWRSHDYSSSGLSVRGSDPERGCDQYDKHPISNELYNDNDSSYCARDFCQDDYASSNRDFDPEPCHDGHRAMEAQERHQERRARLIDSSHALDRTVSSSGRISDRTNDINMSSMPQHASFAPSLRHYRHDSYHSQMETQSTTHDSSVSSRYFSASSRHHRPLERSSVTYHNSHSSLPFQLSEVNGHYYEYPSSYLPPPRSYQYGHKKPSSPTVTPSQSLSHSHHYHPYSAKHSYQHLDDHDSNYYPYQYPHYQHQDHAEYRHDSCRQPHEYQPNDSSRYIHTINNNDVLCGRGGATNSHIGNRSFRLLVKQHQERYLRAKKKEKPEVAEYIVDIVRNLMPPGRFLKKEEGTGYWIDIGDARAKEKTSQALREGAPMMRRTKGGGGDESGGSKGESPEKESEISGENLKCPDKSSFNDVNNIKKSKGKSKDEKVRQHEKEEMISAKASEERASAEQNDNTDLIKRGTRDKYQESNEKVTKRQKDEEYISSSEVIEPKKSVSKREETHDEKEGKSNQPGSSHSINASSSKQSIDTDERSYSPNQHSREARGMTEISRDVVTRPALALTKRKLTGVNLMEMPEGDVELYMDFFLPPRPNVRQQSMQEEKGRIQSPSNSREDRKG